MCLGRDKYDVIPLFFFALLFRSSGNYTTETPCNYIEHVDTRSLVFFQKISREKSEKFSTSKCVYILTHCTRQIFPFIFRTIRSTRHQWKSRQLIKSFFQLVVSRREESLTFRRSVKRERMMERVGKWKIDWALFLTHKGPSSNEIMKATTKTHYKSSNRVKQSCAMTLGGTSIKSQRVLQLDTRGFNFITREENSNYLYNEA